MGSFGGHALPGTFFLFFAIWWTIHITRRMVVCHYKGIAFYSNSAFACVCCLQGWPFEAIVKLIVTSTGMCAEIAASAQPLISGNRGRMDDLNGFWIGDIQHVTMYLMFFLSGVFDVISSRRCKLVPPGMDFISLTLAFIAEGLLFANHSHGKEQLEVVLHSLLVYTVFACAFSSIMEYKFNNIYVAYSRAYFTFVQGTWFWQAAFVLYPPFPWLQHWDPTEDANVMLASAIYTWHLFAAFIVIGVVIAVTYYLSTRIFIVWKSSLEYRNTGLVNRVSDTDSEEEIMSDNESQEGIMIDNSQDETEI